jgi:DNA-binding transcriptional LysR family regulator
MTDKEIRYFLEIVNNGCNFTKTAQALYVSQPSLTKRINNLSKALGVKLFDTSKKTAVKLTPAGKIIYDFLSEYNTKLSNSIYRAKKMEQSAAGELKLAVLEGRELQRLYEILEQFSKKNPNIAVSVTALGCQAIEKGLLNNRFDIAITTSGYFRYYNNICVKDLYNVQCLLFFSKSHPLAKKPDLAIEDFKDDVFYCPPDTIMLPDALSQDYFMSKGFVPKTDHMANLDSILTAIEKRGGGGIHFIR